MGGGYSIVMIYLAACVRTPWGFDMPPAIGAALVPLATTIVAVNAPLPRHLNLDVDRD